MQQHKHHHNQGERQRLYTAAEIAQYEYCPLVWWHEQFDPLVKSETEDLFAQMVELEYAYGQEATAVPDYQVIEQVLVRRGAFADDGRIATQEYIEAEDDAEEVAEEHQQGPQINQKVLLIRNLSFIALGGGILMLCLSVAAGFIIGR